MSNTNKLLRKLLGTISNAYTLLTRLARDIHIVDIVCIQLYLGFTARDEATERDFCLSNLHSTAPVGILPQCLVLKN